MQCGLAVSQRSGSTPGSSPAPSGCGACAHVIVANNNSASHDEVIISSPVFWGFGANGAIQLQRGRQVLQHSQPCAEVSTTAIMLALGWTRRSPRRID